jgi:hypothetical protein
MTVPIRVGLIGANPTHPMTFLARRAAMPLLLCFMAVAPCAVRAQYATPPQVLVIREFPKPDFRGPTKEKTEVAYIAAAKAGKPPIHHIALTSVTGPERVLFISGYPSFAALEAEGKVGEKVPSAGAAFDPAIDVSHWVYRPDLSLNTRDLVGVRYLEVQLLIAKPGHSEEFDEWVKMYIDGYKNVPGYNWATYQQVFGTNYYAYLFIARYKSLSEVDSAWGVGGAATVAFNGALGESRLKKLREMWSVVVDSEMTNLFSIRPEMSRPTDDVIKAEPNFWTPTPTSVAKKVITK